MNQQQLTARRLSTLLPDDTPPRLILDLTVIDASDTQAQKAYETWQRQHNAPTLKGQRPLPDCGEAGYGMSASYEDLVADFMERDNLDRRWASRRVGKLYPEQREEFLATCPPGRG